MADILEVPLNKIGLKDRQRQEYGDLAGLAQSILKNGQMQNLLVEPPDANGVYFLIAGGRRLAGLAAAKLDRAIVKVHTGPLDDLTLQELELEENLQRKDLTWQEKEQAIARIHEVKTKSATKAGASWSVQETANLIGVSLRKVHNAIELSKEIEKNPDVASADTAHGAMQRLTKQKDLKRRQTEIAVRQMAENMGIAKPAKVRCIQGDAFERMKEVESNSIDCVFTNPPFGVDIEQVFTSDKEIYKDDYETISALCRNIILEAYRVLKDDRWFVCFYPTLYLDDARRYMAEAGFKFQKVPAIWIKPNKRVGNVGDGTQALVIGYEQFFLARKGDARFHEKSPTNNLFSFDTPDADRIHALQMPPDLWEAILRLTTLRGEVVLEPFSGSGSGGVAAIRRDLDYRGFELNPEYVARANTWIGETLEGKPTTGSIELTDDTIAFD